MHFPQHTPVFRAKDRRLQEIESVARELSASRAFVNLCLENGCPNQNGFLSAAGLLEWLFDNYDSVRVAAGLVPFAPIDGVPAPAFQRLRMANGLFTLFEFCESRAVCLEQKLQLRELQRHLEWALERG